MFCQARTDTAFAACYLVNKRKFLTKQHDFCAPNSVIAKMKLHYVVRNRLGSCFYTSFLISKPVIFIRCISFPSVSPVFLVLINGKPGRVLKQYFLTGSPCTGRIHFLPETIFEVHLDVFLQNRYKWYRWYDSHIIKKEDFRYGKDQQICFYLPVCIWV